MSTPDWYLARSGQTFGPYDWSAMATMASRGLLAPEDQVWDPGRQAWIPWTAVPGLAPVVPPPLPLAPPARPRRRWLLPVAAGLLLLVAAGGAAAWVRHQRRPLPVTYAPLGFPTGPVAPPQPAPASSGLQPLEGGRQARLALEDGSSAAFPGLTPGDTLTASLTRQVPDWKPGFEGVQVTGSQRSLTVTQWQAADPAALAPILSIPAAEAGGVAPETLVLARIADRVRDGQVVRDQVDLLPLMPDGSGHLVARDIWMPASLEAWRPDTSLDLSGTALPLAAAAQALPVQPRNTVRYVPLTYQQHINWSRMPQLVRMVPDRFAPARRKPLYTLSRGDQERELLRPVQNVFVLVHGRNEKEKHGIQTPAEIGTPWWYAYKRDVWTHLYEVFQADHPKLAEATLFFEYIYPSFRPALTGEGASGPLLEAAIREQLKKQIGLNQSYNLFLVAHSMGGIVSRAAVQGFDGNLADQFRHLATWGSPHLGSPLVTLNYALTSPLHLLQAGTAFGAESRKALLQSFLVTDTPGTQDLRWTGGSASYRADLRLDQLGFRVDDEAAAARFGSLEKAAPAVDLRSGNLLYSHNLRRLNGSDKYAGTDKYLFFYGVTAKGQEPGPEEGALEHLFTANALRQTSETGLGATTCWLLLEDPRTPFQGEAQGRGDGASTVASMTGAGLAGRTIQLGECDHEEYFGAPESPGRFAVPGKATATARRTLEELGIGLVPRYNAPELRLSLNQAGDLKLLLEGKLKGDLALEGELVWPGDSSPARRLDPRQIEAWGTPAGSRSREELGVREFRLDGTSKVSLRVTPGSLRGAGLGKDKTLEVKVRLFLKDGTALESEPLALSGKALLSGHFLGTIRATYINREYLLGRCLGPNGTEMERVMHEANQARNRNHLASLDWAGVTEEGRLSLAVFTQQNLPGTELSNPHWIDFIWKGPRGTGGVVPNAFIPYKDQRDGPMTLELTPTGFSLVKTIPSGDPGCPIPTVWRITGTLRGHVLSGTWSATENGTKVYEGVFTTKPAGS